MSNPKSWEDVQRCSCPFCLLLWRVRLNLEASGCKLFVFDCRMHDGAYLAADVDRLFNEPADVGPCTSLEGAVAFVLERQPFCDALVSTFPKRPAGSADYGWSKLEFLRAEGTTNDANAKQSAEARIDVARGESQPAVEGGS